MPTGTAYRNPAVTTAPVANTTSGLYTFSPGASVLFLHNFSGALINIAFNGVTAAVALHDLKLADATSQTLKAADFGVGVFDTVSVWFPTGATVGNFEIRGA